MLWSGEEQGLLGSRAYIRAHPEETPKVSAVLVHDGGTNYVSGIHATEAMAPIFDKAFEPLQGLNPEMAFTVKKSSALPYGIGSDHDSYLGVGVPGFHWLQAGRAKYVFTHHTQHDTFEQAIPEYQRHSATVIAIGALRVADLAELLPRTGLRALAPTKRKMLGVQLDETMQVLELVKDGAAEKAGVKIGDKLLKFNNQLVGDTSVLSESIQKAPKASRLLVQRDGKEMEIPVTIPD
jgi:Zn-dependent M28 family amino/carboxypeptidase